MQSTIFITDDTKKCGCQGDYDQCMKSTFSGNTIIFFDIQFVCCYHPKFQTKRSFQREICPKGADGMANSVDSDQTLHL